MRLQSQDVQVLVLYLVHTTEQGAEIIGGGEVPAGQGVAASAGELEDEVCGLAGVGAVPGGEAVADPAGYPRFGRAWIGCAVPPGL